MCMTSMCSTKKKPITSRLRVVWICQSGNAFASPSWHLNTDISNGPLYQGVPAIPCHNPMYCDSQMWCVTSDASSMTISSYLSDKILTQILYRITKISIVRGEPLWVPTCVWILWRTRTLSIPALTYRMVLHNTHHAVPRCDVLG